MNEYLNVLNQQWVGIIGVIIAVISLAISIYSVRRATVMRNQQEQERLFKEIKLLLDIERTKSRRFINKLVERIPQVIGCSNDEGRIIRETNRYFGRLCRCRLEKIIELHKEAQKCNFGLSKLFNMLSTSAPDTLASLENALIAEMKGETVLLDDPCMKETIENASVKLPNNDLNEIETYNFREIYGRYLRINQKIDTKTEKLELKLKKKMLTR